MPGNPAKSYDIQCFSLYFIIRQHNWVFLANGDVKPNKYILNLLFTVTGLSVSLIKLVSDYFAFSSSKHLRSHSSTLFRFTFFFPQNENALASDRSIPRCRNINLQSF